MCVGVMLPSPSSSPSSYGSCLRGVDGKKERRPLAPCCCAGSGGIAASPCRKPPVPIFQSRQVKTAYFVKRNSGVEGWGCWLWINDVQRWWLCFRAGRRCCTEALSDVGINPSPILLGKLLDTTVYLCIYYISLILAFALRISDA